MPSRLMMIVEKEMLYRFEVEHKKYEPLIRMLLRAYSGLFEEFVTINEHEISRFLETDRDSVIKQLKELQQSACSIMNRERTLRKLFSLGSV